MKISIIGAGNIGGTLGRKWADANHTITFGVRNPADPKHTNLSTIGAVTSIAEALADTEIILLALPGSAVADLAAQYSAQLAGKIVIDATNNPRSPVMNNFETLQSAAPDAVLIRAFSTLGWENFANPQLGGQQIDLFYCGAEAARPVAEQLIKEIGLRPVYLGGLEAVPAVDGMTRAWFALAFGQGKGRQIAFKLLER
jgi:predicted dinucleotide-binding enzyme